MKRAILVVFLAIALAGMVSAAKMPKVEVCHVDGTDTYHLISINENALQAHLNHGDALPGTDGLTETCEQICEYEVIETGESYEGLYGSTVTPVTVTYEDCSTVDALKIEKDQSFGSCGWAGWSCIEPGYPDAIGGGIIGNESQVCAQGLAEEGVTVGGNTYPTYPHYTYPAGEEGWVVSASSGVTGVYAICAE